MTDTEKDSAGSAPTSNSALLDSGVDQSAQPDRSFLSRLYTGTGAFEVVGRRRFFYLLTAAVVLICLLSMVFRGFTLGIDFEGGTQIQVPASDGITTEQVETVFTDTLGFGPEQVQTVGSGAGATVQVRSEALDAGQTDEVRTALFAELQPVDNTGTATPNAISFSDVSETWGGQITQKALIALVVFLVLVSIYIAIRYERDMALAALAALFFDLLVTAGVYSLVGFEVTPATVIGLLTILGFSLYDSVVVFDKVEENTRGVLHLNRRTYAEQANLAVNQTLMRSINTTVIGILPVLALMVIAVWLLGVGTLKDLALVQLVGIMVGTYSSIFFATPLLVSIKEKWGPVAAHTKKVHGKRAEAAERARSGNLVGAGAGAGVRSVVVAAEPAPDTPRVGSRPTGKRGKKRR